MRSVSGTSSGRPNPPASSTADRPWGSSSRASGLPRVSATIRSRTCSSTSPGSPEASSERACPHRARRARAPASRGVPRCARGHEHDRDRLREQPAGDERQRERGFLVEPLRIVDRAEKRLLVGRIREQAERREADDEAIRCLAVADPERHAHCLALGVGQAVEPVEHRRAELVQAGKRELDLRLNSDRPQQPQVRRRIDRVVQQRGLADPRLSAHHEGAALPRARRAEQSVESGALRVAATQGYSAVSQT